MLLSALLADRGDPRPPNLGRPVPVFAEASDFLIEPDERDTMSARNPETLVPGNRITPEADRSVNSLGSFRLPTVATGRKPESANGR